MYVLTKENSENGSVLIAAILLLFVLTLLGISATTTTVLDLRIAGNERIYVNNFYTADSGWKVGGGWLESLAGHPTEINSTGDIVRNYGDGGQDVLNDTFPNNTEDSTLNGIPYWYRVTYLSDGVVAGSGKDYRNFTYQINSNANRSHQVEAVVSKVFKASY